MKSIEKSSPSFIQGDQHHDVAEAFQALLGHDAAGLSATTIAADQVMAAQYATRSKHSLEGKRRVYVWADGVYFNVRLKHRREPLLSTVNSDRLLETVQETLPHLVFLRKDHVRSERCARSTTRL